jgi:hypothetical protein
LRQSDDLENITAGLLFEHIFTIPFHVLISAVGTTSKSLCKCDERAASEVTLVLQSPLSNTLICFTFAAISATAYILEGYQLAQVSPLISTGKPRKSLLTK